ncbi:MAG: imidazole glycerol phosphate synthase subunit HisF [Gemmatimonadetes bacterium]|nr:imidazole glycerol phosphate synthase subunit HisF [Gemmatimonadota bacterium]
MLTVRIVPCLDVRDGRVVKGVRFQGLRDQGDPADLSAAYEEQGADEVVVLDVSATPEGRSTALETVRRVRARLSVPITVGGGVRRVEDAEALLEAGADKVSVNTAAVSRPRFLQELSSRFGAQCVVLAIDAAATADPGCASGYEVVVRSGTERTGRDVRSWAAEAQDLGAGEILLTSFDQDGTREGYELSLLAAVREAVHLPIVASGGADSPEHMARAVDAGADAVLAASIFHQGDWTVGLVKDALEGLGVPVRPRLWEGKQT